MDDDWYDEIAELIQRINELLDDIELHLAYQRIRLAGIRMEINKYMRMYNGNKRIKIYYQNVPGTLSKQNLITTIESLIDRLDPDVLAIAEPAYEDLDHDWYPYSLVKGYIQNGKKIRLNVLVKSNISFTQNHWNVEVPHVNLCIGGWMFTFAYREWAKCGDQLTKSMDHQLERWEKFVGRWSKEKGSKRMVMGDLNFDYWRTAASQKCLRPIRDLVLENITASGWYQLINEPTRYQNGSISCLDHLYSRSVVDIVEVKNENETGYDHNCIGAVIDLSNLIQNPQVSYFRNIEGIAIDDFAYHFFDLDYLGILRSQDVNEATELLTHNITVVLNKLAPVKKRVMKMKTSVQWLTPDLRARIKLRNALRMKAVKSKQDDHWREFKTFRNLLKTDMLKQKKLWIRSQLTRQNDDPKSRWRAIKAATQGKAHQNNIVLNTNNGIIYDPEPVANHLNNYYVEKVQAIIDKSPPDPSVALRYTDEYVAGRDLPEFEFACVSTHEVLNIVNNLKQTGAVGHDQISTRVIKKFIKVLLPYITKIINLSIMTCTYPQQWKFGIISPVPKGGDPMLDKNWRPVTLLPIMSKILEAVLNTQLKSHMEVNRILSRNQHAYRSSKSTQTAWADLDTLIQKAVDSGKYVGILLVDMSAAFNLVSKEIIVPKLQKLGVGRFAAKLIHSYLTSRKSRVKVKGVYSAWIEVKTGIGEGSVLGPLIFILTIVCCSVVLVKTINRLKNLSITAEVTNKPKFETQVSLSSVEFADDCSGVTICDTEEQVQLSLQIMAEEYEDYFSSHGLKINVTKSEHIVIGHPRTRQITVDGRPEAKEVKLLGLRFSNNYKFDLHTDTITGKIASRTGQLSKLVGWADQETMKTLANATILPVASYGAPIYASGKSNVNRVQIKINKCMRLITNSKLSRHVADMIKELNWMKFTDMVDHAKIMLLHKISCFFLRYCIQCLPEQDRGRDAQKWCFCPLTTIILHFDRHLGLSDLLHVVRYCIQCH